MLTPPLASIKLVSGVLYALYVKEQRKFLNAQVRVKQAMTILVYKGNGKTNLGLCEGDCDEDADCTTGFYCFRRNRFKSVPGCKGKGACGNVYCIPLEVN